MNNITMKMQADELIRMALQEFREQQNIWKI